MNPSQEYRIFLNQFLEIKPFTQKNYLGNFPQYIWLTHQPSLFSSLFGMHMVAGC